MVGKPQNPGLMYRAAESLLGLLTRDDILKWRIRATYIQIYLEKVYDLLNKNAEIQLNVNGDPKQVNRAVIEAPEDVLAVLSTGSKYLKTSKSKKSPKSSRSHSCLRLSGQIWWMGDSEPTEFTLNLLDLAGAERVTLFRLFLSSYDESRIRKYNF